jgi:two-component system response regulator
MKDINILLVEDNEAHAELIVRGLKKGDSAQRIHVVRDGHEALACLFDRGRSGDKAGRFLPDLIILDLKLHKMDGIEVLRRVKGDEGLRNVPVVIFSSSGYRDDIDSSYSTGAERYFVKPIDPKAFQQKLQEILSCVAESNAVPNGD